MSYGIEIRNESSENLVDYTSSLTYYKKSSGVCKLGSDVPNASSTTIIFRFLPATSWRPGINGPLPHEGHYANYNVDYYYRLKTHLACAGIGSIVAQRTSDSATVTKYYPKAVTTNKDDLIFFEIPSEGTIGVYQVWFPFTGTDVNSNTVDVGLAGIMVPHPSYTGSALNYQIVSNDLPTRNANYGIVVYDDDGTTIMFDTSREVASFKDHIFLSAADASDIINNNTSRVFTLRTTLTNFWLCSDGAGATNYKISYSGAGIDMYTLLIKQTGPSEITISRNYIDTPNFSWGTIGPFENYEDCLLIVADFG